jgi:hypothetical protein
MIVTRNIVIQRIVLVSMLIQIIVHLNLLIQQLPSNVMYVDQHIPTVMVDARMEMLEHYKLVITVKKAVSMEKLKRVTEIWS